MLDTIIVHTNYGIFFLVGSRRIAYIFTRLGFGPYIFISIVIIKHGYTKLKIVKKIIVDVVTLRKLGRYV